MIKEDAENTFSSEYIRKKRDRSITDESASQSEPKKEEYDVKIGNLNNQNMDIDIRQAKDGKIIDNRPFSLNEQTTVPPMSGGKKQVSYFAGKKYKETYTAPMPKNTGKKPLVRLLLQ